MNELSNKLKKKEFIEAVQNEEENGKTLIQIDKTNMNLFLRKNFGRSFKGE